MIRVYDNRVNEPLRSAADWRTNFAQFVSVASGQLRPSRAGGAGPPEHVRETVMSDEQELTDLINRVRAGDREAAAELVARYGPELKAVVRHALGRGNRLARVVPPSDLVQSVLLALLAGGNGAEPVANGRSYLTTVAHNRVRHHGRRCATLKRGGDRVACASASEMADPNPPPAHGLAVREEWEALLRALPATEQAIAVLRLEGLTFTQIAEQLGQSPAAVQRRFRRAVNLVLSTRQGAPKQ